MKAGITSFLKDENAQALVEYALLLFILTIASYAGIKLFVEAWKVKFNKIQTLRTGPAGLLP